jgi:uncharacterized protein
MELAEFFKKHGRAALAFSGGVDSSYLLCAAVRAGADVRAYYVSSAFQPRFEREDAVRMAKLLGADMRIIEADVLADPAVASNPPDRCYYCKWRIFSAITAAALADGYDVIFDGTNASDDEGDRPGMRALRELRVLSPLRECGLAKSEIRRLSKEAGLFTWDKPAYACLATRVQDSPLTAAALKRAEEAENAVSALGFTDFRVRTRGDRALVQVTDRQYGEAVKKWKDVLAQLSPMFSGGVELDAKKRKGEVF